MRKQGWLAVISSSALAAVLIGCGGSGGSDLTGGSGGSGGGGALQEQGTARVNVNTETGVVTVTPLDMPAPGSNQSNSLFTGSSVSISSTSLFTDPGEITLRKLSLTIKNNTSAAIGTGGGSKLIIDKVGETDALDLRPFSHVATIIGPGTSSGDGPGPSVTITQPTGVDRDTDGTLYVTGSGDGALRKYKDGNVSRLAIGLTAPGGVAVSSGFVFVMEQTGHQLVRIPTSGGNKFVMAGNGTPGNVDGSGAAARFDTPRDIEVFGTTAYISDVNNDRIRTATNLTGGSATVGTLNVFPVITGPSGLAYMNLAGVDWLVVTSSATHSVYLVNIANGQSFKIAGTGVVGSADGSGLGATFNTPYDAAVSNGSILVSDLGGRTIRQLTLNSGAQPQFSSSWVVKTIAGTGTNGATDGSGDVAQFGSPRFMETDGSGGIVVADLTNNRFRKLNAVSGVFPVTGTGPGTGGIVDVAKADGYVPAPGNDLLNKPYFDIAALAAKGAAGDSDVQEVIFSIGSNVKAFSFVVSLAASADFLNSLDAVVAASSPFKGSPNVNVRSLAGTLPGYSDGTPINAKFASNGDLFEAGNGVYIADGTNNTIRRYDKVTGKTTTILGHFGDTTVATGNGTNARVGGVFGIWINDTETEGFITSADKHYVGKLTHFTPPEDPNLPDQWLMVPIAGLPGTSGNVTNTTGDVARLDGPQNIVADATGNVLYVAESGNNRILKCTFLGGDRNTPANWFVSILAGDVAGTSGDTDSFGTGARFRGPTGIVQVDQSTLLVTEPGGHRIRRVTIDGNATTFAGSNTPTAGYVDAIGTAARFNIPLDLAVGDGGMVYVADFNNTAIRRIRLSTGEVMTTAGDTSAGSGVDGPGNTTRFLTVRGMTFDSKRGLYVMDNGKLKIVERIIRNGAP
jgi:hypothetical protein